MIENRNQIWFLFDWVESEMENLDKIAEKSIY